jgi:type IV pilus assembly protein PilE
MIVVVVVAVLASVAFPSYVEHVERARRQEATAALLENAQFMERLYTQNSSYVLPTTVSLPITATPRDSVPLRYDIAVVSTDTTYTMTATPHSGYSDTKCGSLSVDHLGNRTVGVTGAEDYCWRK